MTLTILPLRMDILSQIKMIISLIAVEINLFTFNFSNLLFYG